MQVKCQVTKRLTSLRWQEVAEPLMDLKESVQELHNNETFKHILATLLAIGNFLNGKKVCGQELCSCLGVFALILLRTVKSRLFGPSVFQNFR